MEKKELVTKLIVEPKQFITDDGEKCDYLDCSLMVNNVAVKIVIQKDYKQLFKHLIGKV